MCLKCLADAENDPSLYPSSLLTLFIGSLLRKTLLVLQYSPEVLGCTYSTADLLPFRKQDCHMDEKPPNLTSLPRQVRRFYCPEKFRGSCRLTIRIWRKMLMRRLNLSVKDNAVHTVQASMRSLPLLIHLLLYGTAIPDSSAPALPSARNSAEFFAV